jgi:hypothetical protein
MDTTAAGSQLEYFLHTLFSFAGMAGLVTMVFLVILCYVVRPFRWWVLGALMFLATLPVTGEMDDTLRLVFPLETLRMHVRGLTIGLLLVLFCAALGGHREWRRRLITPAAWAFFAFELLYACRIWFGGQVDRGFSSLLLFVMIFLTFNLGPSRWLSDFREARGLMRSFVIAATLYVGASTYQLLMSRASLGNRFFGVSANPQLTALNLALFFVPCLAMLVDKQTRPMGKVRLSALIGVLLALLIWTGSRTGALMTMVAVLFMLRLNLRRAVIFAVIGGVGLFVAWSVLDLSGAQAERLLSLQNTRGGIATQLLSEFTSSPAFGTMGTTVGVRENSYLSVLALSGLFGGIPFFLAIGLLVWSVARLQRSRKVLGEHAIYADMLTAGFASILVGALGEGFLLGLLTAMIVGIYSYFSLMGLLFDTIVDPEQAAARELASSPSAADFVPEYDADRYEAGHYSHI